MGSVDIDPHSHKVQTRRGGILTFSQKLLSNSLPPGKNVRSNITEIPHQEMIRGPGNEQKSNIPTPGTAR